MAGLERRLDQLREFFGEAQTASTLEEVAASYVSAFADAPPRIQESAMTEAAHVLSLGDGPQTEKEWRWLRGLAPTQQAGALFLYRVLWRRPKGLPSASSERIAWESRSIRAGKLEPDA